MGGCRECAVGLLGACREDYCRSEREPLIEDASGLAAAHGHALSDFVKVSHRPVWQAHCLCCGRLVKINLDPVPNEPDVGGEACETDCEGQVSAAVVEASTSKP